MITRIVSFLLLHAPIFARRELSCSQTELVVYTLSFETYWTRHLFPKQYPEFRPPAHWSKLIGMTHDEDYILFRVGEIASQGMKNFAETGKTDLINTVEHTFDEFYTPSFQSGVGKADVNFFADGNHTMVSLAVKIIPSPDWFVGVDSLLLCNRGKWIESATIRGYPIDAGTDNGFTFTAPNWETDPQENISIITSRYPKDPANSFFYPELDQLPTIATFRFRKKKMYHLVKAEDSTEEMKTSTEEPIPIVTGKKILKRRKHKKRRKHHQPVVTCQMNNWSQWSNCNATCGKGYSSRTRKILTPGINCSHVTEERKCRSYSGCYRQHFVWL